MSRAGGGKKLSSKQLRYLFAIGFLGRSGGGKGGGKVVVKGDISKVTGKAAALARAFAKHKEHVGDAKKLKDAAEQKTTNKKADKSSVKVPKPSKAPKPAKNLVDFPKDNSDLKGMQDASKTPFERLQAEPKTGKSAKVGDREVPKKYDLEHGTDFSKLPEPAESDLFKSYNQLGTKYNTPSDRQVQLGNGEILTRPANKDYYVNGQGKKIDLETVARAHAIMDGVTSGEIDARVQTIKEFRAQQISKQAQNETKNEQAVKQASFDLSTSEGRAAKATSDALEKINNNQLARISVSGKDYLAIKNPSGNLELVDWSDRSKKLTVEQAAAVEPKALVTDKPKGPATSKATAALDAIPRPAPTSEKYANAKSFKAQGDADSYGVSALGKWDDSPGPAANLITGPDKERLTNALAKYKDEGYADINNALRASGKSDNAIVQDRIDALDTVFAQHAKSLPEPITVHRGVRDDYGKLLASQLKTGQLKVGSVMEDAGFLSTSASPTRSMKADVQLRITAPKGKKGVFMGTQFESEILFDRGSRVRITGYHVDSKGKVLIDAEMD